MMYTAVLKSKQCDKNCCCSLWLQLKGLWLTEAAAQGSVAQGNAAQEATAQGSVAKGGCGQEELRLKGDAAHRGGEVAQGS